ncbi:MAG TPA: hypothetical protein VII75_01555 [Thermoanaerobaculia bacterium]
MSDVHLHIEELVVDEMPGQNAEHQLAQQLQEQGVPQIAQKQTATTIAKAIANAIHGARR